MRRLLLPLLLLLHQCGPMVASSRHTWNDSRETSYAGEGRPSSMQLGALLESFIRSTRWHACAFEGQAPLPNRDCGDVLLYSVDELYDTSLVKMASALEDLACVAAAACVGGRSLSVSWPDALQAHLSIIDAIRSPVTLLGDNVPSTYTWVSTDQLIQNDSKLPELLAVKAGVCNSSRILWNSDIRHFLLAPSLADASASWLAIALSTLLRAQLNTSTHGIEGVVEGATRVALVQGEVKWGSDVSKLSLLDEKSNTLSNLDEALSMKLTAPPSDGATVAWLMLHCGLSAVAPGRSVQLLLSSNAGDHEWVSVTGIGCKSGEFAPLDLLYTALSACVRRGDSCAGVTRLEGSNSWMLCSGVLSESHWVIESTSVTILRSGVAALLAEARIFWTSALPYVSLLPPDVAAHPASVLGTLSLAHVIVARHSDSVARVAAALGDRVKLILASGGAGNGSRYRSCTRAITLDPYWADAEYVNHRRSSTLRTCDEIRKTAGITPCQSWGAASDVQKGIYTRLECDTVMMGEPCTVAAAPPLPVNSRGTQPLGQAQADTVLTPLVYSILKGEPFDSEGWFSRYFAWHSSVWTGLKMPKGTGFVVHKFSRSLGLGNLLQAAFSSLLAAMVSERLWVLDWPDSIRQLCFGRFTSELNFRAWRERFSVEGPSLEYNENHIEGSVGKGMASVAEAFGCWDLKKIWLAHAVVQLRSYQLSSVFIEVNPLYKDAVADEFGSDFYGRCVRQLLIPSLDTSLYEEAVQSVKRLRKHGSLSYGIQLRVGYYAEYVRPDDTPDLFATCARAPLPNNSVTFIGTDNAVSRDLLASKLYACQAGDFNCKHRTFWLDRTSTAPPDSLPSSLRKGGTLRQRAYDGEEGLNSAKAALLDALVLATCDSLLTTGGSTFGQLAVAIGNHENRESNIVVSGEGRSCGRPLRANGRSGLLPGILPRLSCFDPRMLSAATSDWCAWKRSILACGELRTWRFESPASPQKGGPWGSRDNSTFDHKWGPEELLEGTPKGVPPLSDPTCAAGKCYSYLSAN